MSKYGIKSKPNIPIEDEYVCLKGKRFGQPCDIKCRRNYYSGCVYRDVAGSERYDLSSITGTKIRRQFFSYIFYMAAMSMYMIVAAVSFALIPRKELSIGDFISMLTVSTVFLAPLAVLAVISWFCIGRVICVVNENGIYQPHRFISWDSIQSMIYDFELPSRYRNREILCRLTISLKPAETPESHWKPEKPKDIVIISVPYAFRWVAKRYCPNVKFRLSRYSRIMLAIFAAMPFVALALSFANEI